MGLLERFKKALSNTVFKENENGSVYYEPQTVYQGGVATRMNYHLEKNIINSIITRIAIDVSMVEFKHSRIDSEERFAAEIDSDINKFFSYSANIDQTSRDMIRDLVITMLSTGSAALVPVHTDVNPQTGEVNMLDVRVATIVEWHSTYVKVNVYNEVTGNREDINIDKERICIFQNPFFTVMNGYNSTFSRLGRKLDILDALGEEQASGKINAFIKLPVTTKTELKEQKAYNRLNTIEKQLKNSKFGLAYLDPTEDLVPLSRPMENDLLAQCQYLTELAFSQLGISQDVLNGTAGDAAMAHYRACIVDVIVEAILSEVNKKWIKNPREERLLAFRNLFRTATLTEVVSAAEALTRSEIMSSNEMRSELGRKPSGDPAADELRNKNLYTEGSGITENGLKKAQTAANDVAQEEM